MEKSKIEVLKYPDPILSKVSDEITDFGEDLIKLIEDLYLTAASLPQQMVAGLAAPQIGINKRVFVALGRIFVNPKVTFGKQVQHCTEGCFSDPDGPTKMYSLWRPQSLWIEWQDLQQKWHKQKFNGYIAEVISHEIDHLNGVMCLNRASVSSLSPTT